MRKHTISRIIISLVLLAVFVLHLIGTVHIKVLDQLERFAYDERLQLTMPNTVDNRVVIVDIDEKSLVDQGQWPWTRDKMAELVTAMFDNYGISAAGFDVVFAEPDETSGLQLVDGLLASDFAEQANNRDTLQALRPYLATDELFANALQGRNVVMGYVFKQRLQQQDSVVNTLGQLPAALSMNPQEVNLPWLRPKGYTANLAQLQQASKQGGFFDNPSLDGDGVFRRVPLLQNYQGELYESLALRLLRAAKQWPEPTLVFLDGDSSGDYHNAEGLVGLQVGPHTIATDSRTNVLVPYRGGQGSFAYVSATDVLTGKADIEFLFDAIVLVGSSAPGLLDLRATPVAKQYAGVEVHANIISGLLDGQIKEEQDWVASLEILILCVLAIMFTWLLPRLSPGWDFLMLLIGLAAVTGLSFWFWLQLDLVMGMAVPAIFLLALFFLQTSYGLFVESRSKRRLNRIFGQYVPPELVDELDLQDASLEGDAREMTVLFSDVRGFTGLSEGMAPKELTQLMNELLTPLTQAIHTQRGTIDKYIGDAIMAFWGAPLPTAEHASLAVQAALDMQIGARQISQLFVERGWPPVGVAIGLNTGVMNVGNMGSDFRMAYTVLGDAVNLGARLEGLTRVYGVDIMVSETTKAAAPEFVYRQLDCVRVKGRETPVKIYEPLTKAPVTELTTANIARFHQALECYWQQQWDAAEQHLLVLKRNQPEPLYDLYLNRIAAFRAVPPAEDWDGVCTFTTK